MNSHTKRASSSKKTRRVFVALAALLLVGALLVSAGAATVYTTSVTSVNGQNPNDIQYNSNALNFGVGDDVTVTVTVTGTASANPSDIPFDILITNAANTGGNPTLDLNSVTITWEYANCDVENEDYEYNGVTIPDIDRIGNTVTISTRPDDVFGSVRVYGTIVPESNEAPTAKITVSGKVKTAESYVGKTESELKQLIDDMVDVTIGDRDHLNGYTITATLSRDDHYTAPTGGSGPQGGSVIQTPAPLPTTQTVTVSASGTATAAIGGTTYTIDLGAGATGNVIVAALGADVQLPAGADVLTGADITLTVPLANGKTASVAMSLSKSKLPAGASVADVVMQHFENGQWVDLPTVYTEYGSTVKYAGTTDSFSPFILVHKVNGATPAETVPTTTPTASVPTETPASPGFGILAALAGLGAVAVLRRN